MAMRQQSLAATKRRFSILKVYQYVNAKLAMLSSVAGCSIPNFVLRVPIACTSSFSASSSRFWF
ncbi:hypothetical protein ARSEF4850_009093, partial [Beauveria asiatica]